MYLVDFSNGVAIEDYCTKMGNKKVNNFLIFLDKKGAYICARNRNIYLNEINSYFE